MSRRQEVQLANWAALHDSILGNIADAKNELTKLFSEKASLPLEIIGLKRSRDLEAKILQDVISEQEREREKTKSIFKQLEKERNELRDDKSKQVEVLELLKEESRGLINRNKSLGENHVRRVNEVVRELDSYRSLVESTKSEIDVRLGELNRLENECKKQKLINESITGEERQVHEEKEKLSREIDILKKESAKLDADILEKQRSLQGAKANMEWREKKIGIKENDLTILENRIRRQLEGLNKTNRFNT